MDLGRRTLLLLALMAASLCFRAEASKLKVGYYSYTCPKVEELIEDELGKALKSDPGIGADILRMQFHDCFVHGCDGSLFIDSTKGNSAEKDGLPNQTIEDEAFDVIDDIKARVEKECKGVVSCADILAFASRSSIAHYGGFHYDVPAGRRDGRISRANDTADLPPPIFNLTLLLPMFTKKGMNLDDIVTLSGAHTIGIAHCGAFQKRLYNYSHAVKTDPKLDRSYAAELKNECPDGSNNTVSMDPPTPLGAFQKRLYNYSHAVKTDPKLDRSYAAELKNECPDGSNNTVSMDPPTPLIFDTSYYELLLSHRGLFTSDAALLSNRFTKRRVRQYAAYPDVFKVKFAAAMLKLIKIGVRTGKEGEIRANCRVVNKRH